MRRELVVVANRLPVAGDGRGWQPSPGGLVRALEPVMRSEGGAWIGWNGATASQIGPSRHNGFVLHPIALTAAEVSNYYDGFANSVIWPAYHDLAVPRERDRAWWASYRVVNRRFAETAAELAPKDAAVWVHDYHLQLVPKMLRSLRPDLRIGFFLHVPMPAPPGHRHVPHFGELIEGVLGADLIGFQTTIARDAFLAAAPDSRAVGVYPISIDVTELESIVADPQTIELAARFRAEFGSATTLVSADRLDHSKGILQRLRALRKLFASGRLDPQSTLVVQVVVPSRETIGSYQTLRRQIAAEVAEVNAEFGPVIRQIDRSMPFQELVALYLTADVMLVTPLSDGMNLVAKEYVAARKDGKGALVLSARAGAAQEFREAFLADPSDEAALAETIAEAMGADRSEKARRMRLLRAHLQTHDVHHWASRFLADLTP